MQDVSRIADCGLQIVGAVVLAVVLGGCGSSGSSSGTGSNEVGTAPLAVASPDLRAGGVIPRRFTCDGAGSRPRLAWSGVPPQAVEVAVLVGDPDAPGGTFVHWAVWNLPRSATAGTGAGALPTGALEGANSAGGVGWTPPCPPKGAKPHHYIFGVYALRKRIDLPAGADPSRAVPTVRAAAIASGSLTASYGR
jgi:Raf kinase inhibitor-like YbhB/YbcL family protein